jgi:hypothetical protein
MEKTKKVLRRVRIAEKILDHYRAKYPGISLQRFIDLALENQWLRDRRERVVKPF